MAVRERQIQLRKFAGNCGKIAGKLQFWDQTPRSLKEQHLCTGDTQGTNKNARGTRKKQWRKIAGNCGKVRKTADLSPPPPRSWMDHRLVLCAHGTASEQPAPPPPPLLRRRVVSWGWSQGAGTRQHKQLLVSGTIGAFRLCSDARTSRCTHRERRSDTVPLSLLKFGTAGT